MFTDHPTPLEELADALQAAVLLAAALGLSLRDEAHDACGLTDALHRATAALRRVHVAGGVR